MGQNRELARTVALPDTFKRASGHMATRMLGSEPDGSILLAKLFPGREATFGDLWGLTGSDIESAAPRVSAPDARTLAELFRRVNPWIPICNACENFSLSAVGGKIYDTLPPGARCNWCDAGTFALSPMQLRRVHWMTGALVEPGLRVDLRTLSGCAIPLVDEEIARLATNIGKNFSQALSDCGIPLYGLLAWQTLSPNRTGLPRNSLSALTIEEARRFLEHPEAYGIKDRADVERIAGDVARFLDQRETWNVPPEYLSDGRKRSDMLHVTIAGTPYLLEGLIGTGDKCDVYRGRTDCQHPEMVIVKVLVSSSPEDEKLLGSENAILKHLHGLEDITSEYFLRFIPHPVLIGNIVFPNGNRFSAMVLRSAHQFDWTISDILDAYPNGVNPRDAVWLINRMLELLSWLHEHRIVHGAVMPQHVVVKTSEHRVRLVDWGYASGIGGSLRAQSQNAGPYATSLLGEPLETTRDVEAVCRIGIALLGGDPETGTFPSTIQTDDEGIVPVPVAIAVFLRIHGGYAEKVTGTETTSSVSEEFKRVVKAHYGPPSWHEFRMPRPTS